MASKGAIWRNGQALTWHGLEIMQQLAALGEGEWITLPNAHFHTIRSLIVRDYVDWSKATGERTYKLSARGREALVVYTSPAPSLGHTGELCSICGTRPCHVTRSGAKMIYCRECSNERNRIARQNCKDKPCPKCGKPRWRAKSGRLYVYCHECKREVCRASRIKSAERVKAGEVVLCTHCHKNPVLVVRSTVYNECRECRNRRRKLWGFKRSLKKGNRHE